MFLVFRKTSIQFLMDLRGLMNISEIVNLYKKYLPKKMYQYKINRSLNLLQINFRLWKGYEKYGY